MMTWALALLLVSCVSAQVASREIRTICEEIDDFPPVESASPSRLAELNVRLVTVENEYWLNITWAIDIDGSIGSLTGTRIKMNWDTYHCKYKPPLAQANLTGSTKKWFHFVENADCGRISVSAANLPLPQSNSGPVYKSVQIQVPCPTPTFTATTPTTVVLTDTTLNTTVPVSTPANSTYIAVGIFGGLACLTILGSCYIMYRNCKAKLTRSFGFKTLSASLMVPVHVLVVYPAENPSFQRAVVALAEFLQWHGGCSVAVDMWQQGKIAELGPMRWLAEQVKTVDRVLIICPQEGTPSLQSSYSVEPSIPAAAHDLYPLILNTVASHAKSKSDLAKFWVVQLDERPKRPNQVVELRACRTFCLMKDLLRLCKSLHNDKQNSKKISDMIFGSAFQQNAVKLREAVEKTRQTSPSISSEVEPLKYGHC